MMDLVETNAGDDPIRKFQSDIQEKVNQAERLRPIVRACQDAIQRAESKASVVVSMARANRPKVEIMLICSRLEETVPLFREMAKEGFHTDKKDTHKDHNLFDVIAMREYNFGPDVSVIATVVPGDGVGSSCRMEQVGVKEVPVYEMKCN